MESQMIIDAIIGIVVPFIFQLIKKINTTFWDNLQGFWQQLLVVGLSLIIAIIKVIIEKQFDVDNLMKSIGIIFTASQVIYTLVYKIIPKKTPTE